MDAWAFLTDGFISRERIGAIQFFKEIEVTMEDYNIEVEMRDYIIDVEIC